MNELEKSCLENLKNSTLQKILADPGSKSIPNLMTRLVEEIHEPTSSKKVSKKVVSRLANTMALTTTCGAKHNDIDQMIKPKEASRIRDLATSICICKSKSQ